MKTLQEAVNELEALDNPETTLRCYSNKTEYGRRCVTCPVASFLGQRVGKNVWVGLGTVRTRSATLRATGFANEDGSSNHIQLSDKIISIIRRLDDEFFANG